MKNLQKYINLLIGLFLVAFAFNIFLAPYNLAAGGISGISLILNKLTGIKEYIIIMSFNIILLIISFYTLGKNVTKNTILGSILLPIFINLTKYITELIDLGDIELIIISILGGILTGIGYGLIFKSGFTSGGTDIINQIMEKYMHMPISKSIVIIDGLITLSSSFVFGIPSMIYAFISLLLLSIFSNKKIIGIGEYKTVFIISNKYKEIKKYLHNELKIDSTDFDVNGGYNNSNQKMLMSVISTKNYYRIKEAILLIDPKAFMTVTDSYFINNANIKIRKQKVEKTQKI